MTRSNRSTPRKDQQVLALLVLIGALTVALFVWPGVLLQPGAHAPAPGTTSDPDMPDATAADAGRPGPANSVPVTPSMLESQELPGATVIGRSWGGGVPDSGDDPFLAVAVDAPQLRLTQLGFGEARLTTAASRELVARPGRVLQVDGNDYLVLEIDEGAFTVALESTRNGTRWTVDGDGMHRVR